MAEIAVAPPKPPTEVKVNRQEVTKHPSVPVSVEKPKQPDETAQAVAEVAEVASGLDTPDEGIKTIAATVEAQAEQDGKEPDNRNNAQSDNAENNREKNLLQKAEQQMRAAVDLLQFNKVADMAKHLGSDPKFQAALGAAGVGLLPSALGLSPEIADIISKGFTAGATAVGFSDLRVASRWFEDRLKENVNEDPTLMKQIANKALRGGDYAIGALAGLGLCQGIQLAGLGSEARAGAGVGDDFVPIAIAQAGKILTLAKH